MNKLVFKIMVGLVAVLVIAACGQSKNDGDYKVKGIQEKIEATTNEAHEKISEEATDFEVSMADIKDSVVKRLEDLKANANNVTDDAKEAYNKKVDELEAELDEINSKIEDYKHASEEQKENIVEELSDFDKALQEGIEEL